mgnify:FL=1
MTLSQQYDQQKQETADRYREMDAVDEVLCDLNGLKHGFSNVSDETLENLIEQVEEYIHYNESLEYILQQIPTEIKTLLAE